MFSFMYLVWWSFYFVFSSRRRHTRYWRDWSSDVCSSDLAGQDQNAGLVENLGAVLPHVRQGADNTPAESGDLTDRAEDVLDALHGRRLGGRRCAVGPRYG